MLKTSKIKINLSTWLLLIVCLLFLQGCGGLVYHKPAFSGRVLELDTKRPIEGAVVVVIYKKEHPGIGGGAVSYPVAVRETMTDKDGRFKIPSFTTMMAPPFYEDDANFKIYKPGYMVISFNKRLQKCFSGTCQEYSQKSPVRFKGEVVYRYRTGEVELRRMQNRKERLDAYESSTSGYFDLRETPLLLKYLRQERAYLGFDR